MCIAIVVHGIVMLAAAAIVQADCPTINPSIVASFTACRSSLAAPVGYASYRWSTGDTTREITIRSAGTFVVAVTDSAGCTGSDSMTVAADRIAVPVRSLEVDSIDANGGLDMGNVLVFDRRCRSVVVRNMGDERVVLDTAEWAAARGFELEGAAFPIDIQPGAATSFTLCFTALDSALHIDTLNLDTRCIRYSVPVAARGALRQPVCGGRLDLSQSSIAVTPPFPNPAGSIAAIGVEFDSIPPPDLRCRLSDALGRQSDVPFIAAHRGGRFDVPVAGLPAGLYVAVVTAGRAVWRETVSVVR